MLILPKRAATLHREKRPNKPQILCPLASILLLSAILLLVLPNVNCQIWDPYEVLGVERNSNLEQIKSAYRNLARKLHPDKSDLSEEEAGVKFIELNKAFNILKDPEKRSRFEQSGETEDNRSRTTSRDSQHRRHSREYWAQNGYRTFTFYSGTDSSSLRKISITSSQYYNEFLRDSYSRVYFVFFYASFCPSCSMIEKTWTKITDELSKFNIGSFAINVDNEPRLARDSGVSSIPSISCLVAGQLRPYDLPELSLAHLVRFTKQSMPSNLIVSLTTETDQDRFVTSSLQHNRRAIIVISPEENLKLRWNLLAFELDQYYKFGHIPLKSADYKLFSKKFKLGISDRSRICHIVVFDEDIEKPALILSQKGGDLDYSLLRKHLTRWPFLKLPKLSTQQRFDDLCLHTIPKDGDKVRPRLCVILFTTPSPSTRPNRNKLIEFARLNNLEQDERVVFAMIDHSKQTEFVSNLLDETKTKYPFGDQNIDSTVILLERHPHDSRKAHYMWLENRWNTEDLDELDRAKLLLYNLIQNYKLDPTLMKNKVVLNGLIDEEGPGLIGRVFWRFVNNITRLTSYITHQDSFATVMVLISCALLTSFYVYKGPLSPSMSMNQEASDDEYNRYSTKPNSSANSQPKFDIPLHDELKILELKAETYNGMVRLLKPGYRSIILLTDNETRDELFQSFKKAVWPYRRNKTLLFGFLCLDKNITWYKSLLQKVTGINNLNVNKKNCIGTVLSLNGFRKYLRVYHAKHHEIDRYDIDTDNDGSFFGTDQNEDDIESNTVASLGSKDSGYETQCAAGNLLDRLPIWLDKTFDGLTKRYFLDCWPEDIN